MTAKNGDARPPHYELFYRLSNPGYTIYHRAALGGLAATVNAWRQKPRLKPEGIEYELKSDSVRLYWGETLNEQEALRRILDASFKRTPDRPDGGKMIDLPGHAIEHDEDGLRLAVHTALLKTFLQHNKVRGAEKNVRPLEIKTADEESGIHLTYQALDWYAHQEARKTGLLNGNSEGSFPDIALIPSSLVPGAMSGAVSLEATPEDAILLLYLIVGCALYFLQPRKYKDKARYAVIVPDVDDLVKFADALQRLAARERDLERFRRNYLNRVVGGAEEAALSFLVDMGAGDIARKRNGIAGCIAIGMGAVAWDKQQQNRSMIFKVGDYYDELDIFLYARKYLSKPITGIIKRGKRKGETYIFLMSHVPELIAANLAAGRHWCAYFYELVQNKKDFQRMQDKSVREGLKAMNEAVKDANDQTIIRAFHEAWGKTMSNLGRRDKERGADAGVSIQNRKEKIRNDILRQKTAEAMAGWFLEFCANATRGNALEILRDPAEARRVREFIFNSRNFERLQNLCLFALVSYAGKEKVDDGKGEQK